MFFLCGMDEVYQNIIKTASELFKSYGLKSITMDDVANACMISKKTLYKYVKDKVDLLFKAYENEFSKQSAQFIEIVNKNLNAIEEVFEIHKNLIKMLKATNPVIEFDLIKYYPKIHKQILEDRSKMIYKMMLKNMKKGIDEGLYYDDLDIELIAKQRVIFQVQKVENCIVSYKQFATPHAMKQMFIYHLRAICNPEGLKILNHKIKEFDEHEK
jgi:AcrR family transcriptional regulator